ncbi:DUF262 domain-containing protein [Rufibacter aurantiacus]|uniref:DUF262 domain-containing protein n=1 Tax=Rufibacter aurantiacus TaxID=2817374 RepID=UPI001B302F46|nr:DUF262 domain-containing protein [Rufibacter aurantiacus]
MTNSKQKFRTAIVSLANLNELKFSIPTYQRPYVWKEEQIDKLLTDSANAFSTDRDKPYFIGTILTDDKKAYLELIDGQQRFTTLWLIAFVFYKNGIKSEVTNFLKYGDNLRLDFEIRKEVKEYFDLLLKHPEEALTKYTSSDLNEKPYLINIVRAVTTIEHIILSLRNSKTKELIDLPAFGYYLYTNLLLVNNTAPVKVDLNKLFATINNSGIQLEQTDIVKANLLRNLESEKVLYSKMWECCENMSEYFERNVRKVFPATNWRSLEDTDFAKFKSDVFKYELINEVETLPVGFTLEEIIAGKADEVQSVSITEAQKEAFEINCSSILNFGQLLLHTYRIYLHRKGKPDFEGTFHVNRLIEVFKSLQKQDGKDIKEFIELLWQVRYVFDAFVIKWITDLDTKERHLELTKVTKTDQRDTYSYFGRNVVEEKTDQLMLQCVLYFTGDYLRQFWLTPFLSFLLRNQANDISKLEDIDNQMSLSKLTDKEASYHLLNDNGRLHKDINLKETLEEASGTSFKHYWFQKLEYILWKNWHFERGEKFKAFRIASKNSVEHIYPQNPQYKPKLDKEYRDSFGNLVLLSVTQNSEYSRKEVNVKREEFKGKNVFDTLKSYHLFNSYGDDFGIDEIIAHRDQMANLMMSHYSQN